MNNDPGILFEIITAIGKKTRLTTDYWNKIIAFKHPNMAGKEDIVINTMTTPDEIRVSKTDKTVFLYYRKTGNYYNAVVVKHSNNVSHVITTYMTDKVKEGKLIWKK
jgi:hypothetical protein